MLKMDGWMDGDDDGWMFSKTNVGKEENLFRVKVSLNLIMISAIIIFLLLVHRLPWH